MPPKKNNTEQNDNTRVILPRIKETPIKPVVPLHIRASRRGNVDSTQRVKALETKRDMANYYVHGSGLQGQQSRYNPMIPEDQQRIESQYAGAAQQASQFMSDVAQPVLWEGGIQAVRSVLSPIWLGTGTSSAVVGTRLPYWIPSNVRKLSTLTRSTVHSSNQAPSVLRQVVTGSKNGKTILEQRVAKIVSGAEEKKAIEQITQDAIRRGYRQIPEQYGLGFSKNGVAYIDLEGNIGKIKNWFTPWKSKYVWIDPAPIPVSELPYLKSGGQLYNKN